MLTEGTRAPVAVKETAVAKKPSFLDKKLRGDGAEETGEGGSKNLRAVAAEEKQEGPPSQFRAGRQGKGHKGGKPFGHSPRKKGVPPKFGPHMQADALEGGMV